MHRRERKDNPVHKDDIGFDVDEMKKMVDELDRMMRENNLRDDPALENRGGVVSDNKIDAFMYNGDLPVDPVLEHNGAGAGASPGPGPARSDLEDKDGIPFHHKTGIVDQRYTIFHDEDRRKLVRDPRALWDKEAKCELLDGEKPLDFSKNFLAPGETTDVSREVVFFDPKSTIVNDLYKELKMKLKKLGDKKEPKAIINATMDFVRDTFCKTPPTLRMQLTELEKIRIRNKIGESKGQDVVDFDTYIKAQVGVCRHHALLMCFLLFSLIEEKILPKGDIFYHRAMIQPGDTGRHSGHVWVMYHEKENDELIVIDSIRRKPLYEVYPNSRDSLIRHYGTLAVAEFDKRYPRKEESISLDSFIKQSQAEITKKMEQWSKEGKLDAQVSKILESLMLDPHQVVGGEKATNIAFIIREWDRINSSRLDASNGCRPSPGRRV